MTEPTTAARPGSFAHPPDGEPGLTLFPNASDAHPPRTRWRPAMAEHTATARTGSFAHPPADEPGLALFPNAGDPPLTALPDEPAASHD